MTAGKKFIKIDVLFKDERHVFRSILRHSSFFLMDFIEKNVSSHLQMTSVLLKEPDELARVPDC